jgi:hypothetical protein
MAALRALGLGLAPPFGAARGVPGAGVRGGSGGVRGVGGNRLNACASYPCCICVAEVQSLRAKSEVVLALGGRRAPPPPLAALPQPAGQGGAGGAARSSGSPQFQFPGGVLVLVLVGPAPSRLQVP